MKVADISSLRRRHGWKEWPDNDHPFRTDVTYRGSFDESVVIAADDDIPTRTLPDKESSDQNKSPSLPSLRRRRYSNLGQGDVS